MKQNVVQVIAQKRDGAELSEDVIADLIAAYARDQVPDYQMAAFAMAVYLNGMTDQETAALTRAMLNSGEILQWSSGAAVVDKHSTGGIGDKVSLVLAPMLAASGLRNPMISGRGLGPTGGTLDKLEAISGFRTDLNLDEIRNAVEQVGCVITGASARIAPADRKLYALRDVTATVPSIPLITASIMSKKLSEGLDALVLDVKFGCGAFMKTVEQAQQLANSLQQTGELLGVSTRCVLTDMNQPLGRMIGNAVEVEESLVALQGNGPADLLEVTLQLGVELLLAAEFCTTPSEARQLLQGVIDNGQAYERFVQMVHAQGGDLSQRRPVGPATELTCPGDGYVAAIENEQLGWAVIALGGGRQQITDRIDHAVGLEYLVRIGEQVSAGQPWLRMFESPDPQRVTQARQLLANALTLSPTPVPPLQLIR